MAKLTPEEVAAQEAEQRAQRREKAAELGIPIVEAIQRPEHGPVMFASGHPGFFVSGGKCLALSHFGDVLDTLEPHLSDTAEQLAGHILSGAFAPEQLADLVRQALVLNREQLRAVQETSDLLHQLGQVNLTR